MQIEALTTQLMPYCGPHKKQRNEKKNQKLIILLLYRYIFQLHNVHGCVVSRLNNFNLKLPS